MKSSTPKNPRTIFVHNFIIVLKQLKHEFHTNLAQSANQLNTAIKIANYQFQDTKFYGNIKAIRYLQI